MENNTTILKLAFSGILAIFTGWFGTIGPLICILLICMIGDYITGLINAGIKGTISSVKGLKGIIKKMLYCML
jgi:phage-related holin